MKMKDKRRLFLDYKNKIVKYVEILDSDISEEERLAIIIDIRTVVKARNSLRKERS